MGVDDIHLFTRLGHKRGCKESDNQSEIGNLRIISWNLLHLTGACVKDVAELIRQHHPDLLLLQEATEELSALPHLIGGHFFRQPLDRRIYGLAAWSTRSLMQPEALPLPVSSVPGRVPPRVAQIVRFREVTFANVHLSHGQFLNRWQLLHITRVFAGAAAIIGDFNAVGPIKLAGFRDIGPRQATLKANNIISFRLDRCMARGLRCTRATVLDRGPSDHHPIVLDLQVVPDMALVRKQETLARLRPKLLPTGAKNWLQTMARTPETHVPQGLFETLELSFGKGGRDKKLRPRTSRTSSGDVKPDSSAN